MKLKFLGNRLATDWFVRAEVKGNKEQQKEKEREREKEKEKEEEGEKKEEEKEHSMTGPVISGQP